jgi:hypothetical protein
MQIQVSLTIEIEASAGITEMEHQVQEAGQQAMRQALKQTIRQWENAQPNCPHCGEPARRLEGTTRRVIATRFGRVSVPRRCFRCLQCGRRSCPANRLFAPLGALPSPYRGDEAAMLAGCSWPYRMAAHLLKQLSGAQISAEEIRLLTNRQGKQLAAQQQEEAEQACACPAQESPSAQHAEQPMLVGLDGAGCAAENSVAEWRAKSRWSAPKRKICRCP